MAQFITLNSPQNFQNASIRPFKQILYTLRDGKLVFTPEDSSDSKSISDNSRSVSSEGFRVVDNHDQDEVYIEIFRENNEKSVLGIIDNKLITSISSAYEAFFEDDFEERIRRQSCVVCGKVFLTLQQLLHHLQYLHKISYPEEVSFSLLMITKYMVPHPINNLIFNSDLFFTVFYMSQIF